jgi:hypothetical protein
MILTLKLLLTPCLIASVSLIERRWGTAISGWFMGFPFISAPISIVLAIQYGPAFAAHAAVGTLGGLTSVCVFCLVYIAVSQKAGWPASLAVAVSAFLLVTAGWTVARLPLWPTFAIDAVVILLVLRLIPRRTVAGGLSRLPQWELPIRMLLAAVFVWFLTTSADLLGPTLSGLLAPFPVINSVVAPFTHRRLGPAAVTQLLRGVVMGLFSFGSFYVVLAALLPSQPTLWAYAAATTASVLAHGLALRFVSPRV